jgi:hypothetical protein
VPLRFSTGLPGPFRYSTNLTGKGSGCGLIIGFTVVVIALDWLLHHWWLLLAIPLLLGHAWLGVLMDERRERRQAARHRR